MIGLLMLVGELVRGAQAPRLLAMAPSPSRTFTCSKINVGPRDKECFGGGAETSRRGVCAPPGAFAICIICRQCRETRGCRGPNH